MGKTKLEKQVPNKPERDAKGRLLPGNTANPNGRPPGKTIKERVREYLEQHPDKMDEFVKHFVETNRELAWQMLEGRPFQDILSGGEKLPTPILNVFPHDGDTKDSEAQKEN